MQQYDSYKPSGVEWIGEVPFHWKKCRFKDFLQLITTPSFSETKIGLENIESSTGRFIPTETTYEGNGVEFNCEDIVYGKLRPYLKKVWLAEFSGNAVGDFFIWRCQGNAKASYVKYLLLSEDFTDVANGSTTGAKMPRVSSDFILTLGYFLPPLEEQERIAEYLDRRCAEIDGIINKEEQAIALLDELKQSIISEAVTRGLDPAVSLKPSGVDWIGNIPSHWQVSRLKNTACLFGRIGYRGYTVADLVNQGEGVITLSPSNMVNGSMDYTSCSYLSWKKYYESPEIMIKNGDILLVKTGSTYGKTSYVSDLPMEATINPQIVVFKSIAGNSKFLFYLLSTHFLQHQIKRGVGGSTIPTLSEGFILNCVHPLPPLEEQERIAEYLDRRCAEIDEAKERKQRQIELLREMKQTMISDEVTGRVKVF